MQAFMFYNPTKLLFGKGQLERLPKEIAPYGKRILLVYGGGSVKRNGIYDAVLEQLELAACEVFELAGVEANPRVGTVRRGVEICKRKQIDFVLALGGGSVIDCVKAIMAAAKSDADAWDVITKKVPVTDALPFGSIVTIAGTGAELSLTSVISNPDLEEKRMFSCSFSRGKFAIVDPSMTRSVPRGLTVNGSIDAMSHVLEHYFNHAENASIQLQHCEAILRTVIDVMPKLLADMENETYRETMMYASTIALSDQVNMGMKGDWGTHHIDHALSAVHDIPHGGGMAILFPHWMRHVLDVENVARFKRLAVEVLAVAPDGLSDREIAEAGIDKLAAIWQAWGAPTRLSEYGITADTFPKIAEKTVTVQPCGNFKTLEAVDVLTILEAAL